MNKDFAPLYRYVASLDLVAMLLEQEECVHGDLADLAFAVEYDREDHPGCGRIAIYRRSSGSTRAPVAASLDNMRGKLWFVENDTWRVERHAAAPSKPSVPRFYALIAYHPDYRPDVRVNLHKSLLTLRVWDLPLMPQYPQRRVMQQVPLALAA